MATLLLAGLISTPDSSLSHTLNPVKVKEVDTLVLVEQELHHHDLEFLAHHGHVGDDPVPLHGSAIALDDHSHEPVRASSASCEDRADHAPIEIIGNGDFSAPGKGVVNPDAAGTPDDPFVIEGWCITGHGAVGAPDQAILLQSTTAHVIIRDNHIERFAGYPDAIVLNGADNIVVQNNTILDHVAGDGVYLQDSHHNLIEGNTIEHRTGHDYASALRGVYLVASTDNTIRGNNLTRHAYTGITLEQSTGNTIVANNITQNGVYRGGGDGGIHLDASPFNLIKNNFIADNAKLLDGEFFYSLPGIISDGSSGNTFVGNRLGEGNGFHIRQRGNQVQPQVEHFLQDFDTTNTVDGKPVVYVRDAQGIVVPQNAGQVFVVNSTDVLVQGIDTYNATFGAVVAFSENVTVRASTFRDHSLDGIHLVGSTSSLIVNNTFTGNREHGVHLEGSSGNTVRSNLLEENVYSSHGAIELQRGSSGNTVEGNHISGTGTSGGWGIITYGGNADSPGPSDNNVIRYNTIVDSQQSHEGIRVWESHENLVQANTIRDAERAGINLILSTGNNVLGNTLSGFGARGIIAQGVTGTVLANNDFSGSPTGVWVLDSFFTEIRDNSFSNHSFSGISLSRNIGVTVKGNNIASGGEFGLRINWNDPVGYAMLVDMTNNWWGHPTGPGSPPGGDPTTGLATFDTCTQEWAQGEGGVLETRMSSVCFTPWLTEPNPQAGT